MPQPNRPSRRDLRTVHTVWAVALALVIVLGVRSHRGLQADDGNAIAFVNGAPIERDDVVQLAMEAHGLSALQQLIFLRLARQETHRLGLEVTRADIEREYENALRRIAPDVDFDDATLTEDDRRTALEQVLEQHGFSLAEFWIGMERNAHLRKIIERGFQVDEATLREEFARTYGEKVVVRHIEIRLENQRKLNEVKNLLNSGTDFAEVARRLSDNPETAPRGGELAPFTFRDEAIPESVREVAFALDEGQVSNAFRVDRVFQILKLERRIPPENVRLADVRDTVEQSMRARVIPQQMARLLTQLFDDAKIRVIDQKLRRRFDDLLRRNAQLAPVQP